ncbi:MAG: hypothetical protein ACKO2P_13550 [Planctomycetota bacterium]
MAPLPLSQAVTTRRLLRRVTCVNCWHEFSPEETLWISEHESLRGEPRIGDVLGNQQRRMTGERFDTRGKAVDPGGAVCETLACPRCLLSIPEDSLEVPPLIFSLLGSPGSGKSVFLAAMTRQLRLTCPSLGMTFADADPVLNGHLINDERRMFFDGGMDEWRAIEKIVSKTEQTETRWRETQIEGSPARFVPPYTFRISPSGRHPRIDKAGDLTTLVCLYDNAGEHFQPGARDAGMTLHLSRSMGLMYCFDPTNDSRVMRALNKDGVQQRGAGERQDTVLAEAAARIRRDMRLGAREKINKPVVMVLPKFDVWEGLLREYLPTAGQRELLKEWKQYGIRGLAEDAIEELSDGCRTMLERVCPDPLRAAEAVSDQVWCIPVAAVGRSVRMERGQFQVRSPIDPQWSEIPLLLLLRLGEDVDPNKLYPRKLVPWLRKVR